MWESTGAILTVATPLVAVPLTVITFYLRSLRDHQVTWHAQMLRRVEASESATTDLRRTLMEWEREYTTKEEMLRESMHTRRVLENLSESTVRIEATLSAVLSTGRDPRSGHVPGRLPRPAQGGITGATGLDNERRS